MDIKPGQKVTITVTSQINKPSAGMTLARLFLKDPRIAKSRRQKAKPWYDRRRAGRYWNVYTPGTVTVIPREGESATILASIDVIRDIHSVAGFVKIK